MKKDIKEMFLKIQLQGDSLVVQWLELKYHTIY